MTLVVGVDPGHRSASALNLAAMLARSADTDLVVAAVVPRTWHLSVGSADAEWRQHTRATADAALDHAAAVLGDAVPARYLVHEAASVRRGLLELAEEHAADLVVVGSSVTAPTGRIALGSETDGLLHVSPVPVAIAPRGFRAPEASRVGRVTAAYHGTDTSADLVHGAADVAGRVGAALRIASFAVVPPVSGAAGTGLDIEQSIADSWAADVQRHAAQLLSEVSALADPPTLEGTVIGRGDDWEGAIADVPWEQDEVLVVGSSSLGPLARVFLGSHATKVVRNSPVPVVVVPRGALEHDHR
ncbi:universal stress protein [Microbacterium capsulatum]|uniref:Universal stress protein n=1 Tax=Microbacterium capsulatum TaxID=3041921 RepID=A0ABU0XDC7_9MICO|nr:universal stress protein [Microbacterium sp. ASV81]MDQ4213066.1 universal stress protein [Microbacterium sp. ASV81]